MDVAGSTYSDLSRAAVDEQLYPGDIGAVVGGEKHRSLAEIVRRAEAAERNGGDDRAFVLIRHQMGQAGGRRGPGTQHVAAQVAPLEVDDPAARKRAYCRL